MSHSNDDENETTVADEIMNLSAMDQIKTLTAVSAKYVPYHDSTPEKTVVRNAEWRLADQPETLKAEEIIVPQEGKRAAHTHSKTTFLQSGRNVHQKMTKALAEDGFRVTPDSRVLDFGCGAARIMRWWLPEARAGAEVWGVDLEVSVLNWCEKHLSPPFNFAATTSQPSLPFEDRSFDLIFAGSVFTHIGEAGRQGLFHIQ